MSLISRSNLIALLLIGLATASQFIKQAWLASVFDPAIYAGWATAVLASQMLFNFGGLGFHNFSARQAAIYESRGKKFLTNSLVSKQILLYTYLLPLSIPIIYFLLAEPEKTFFAAIVIYSLAHVFLNAVTCPTYVRSSLTFSNIQAKRGVGSTIVAVAICLYTGSLILTLITEAFFVFVLGLLTLKSQRIKWVRSHTMFGAGCKALAPFFFPVFLATFSVSLSRLIAIEVLGDESLGIYYFIFLIVSCGVIFQYGVSVIFGPIITSKLDRNLSHNLIGFIFKTWASLVVVALLLGILGYFAFPVLIKCFFAEYATGIVLIFPMLCLAMAKICDIWSVYFLLGGLEKYLYLPHLISILTITVIFFAVQKNNNINLTDMSYFVFGEAIAIFVTPLLTFVWINRKLRATEII